MPALALFQCQSVSQEINLVHHHELERVSVIDIEVVTGSDFRTPRRSVLATSAAAPYTLALFGLVAGVQNAEAWSVTRREELRTAANDSLPGKVSIEGTEQSKLAVTALIPFPALRLRGVTASLTHTTVEAIWDQDGALI